MTLKRGDTAVWIGDAEIMPHGSLVTVGTISPSRKTLIIDFEGEERICTHKEVITLRQAKNRGIYHAERPTEARTSHRSLKDEVSDGFDPERP